MIMIFFLTRMGAFKKSNTYTYARYFCFGPLKYVSTLLKDISAKVHIPKPFFFKESHYIFIPFQRERLRMDDFKERQNWF